MSGSPWKPIFTALLLIASASHARATPIAGNALANSNNGDCLFSTQCSSFITAENFSLNSDSIATGLSFVTLAVANPGSTTSVDWFLYSDTNPINGTFGDPASTLASGSVANPSLTDLNSSPPAATCDSYFSQSCKFVEFSFGITPTELTAGDYWVGFVLNMANNFPADYEADYYWANTSNGDGIFKFLRDGTTWVAGPDNTNLAFAVDSAVPFPRPFLSSPVA